MNTHPLQTGETKCDKCAHQITVPPTKQNFKGVSRCGLGHWEDPMLIPTNCSLDYNPTWDNCKDFENENEFSSTYNTSVRREDASR